MASSNSVIEKMSVAKRDVENGRYAEALSSLNEILDKKPRHARALMLAAHAHYKLGNVSEGKCRCAQAIQVKPDLPFAYLTMARICLVSKKEPIDLVLSMLDRCEKMDVDNSCVFHLANILTVDLKQPRRAAELLERATRKFEVSTTMRAKMMYKAAQNYSRCGNKKDAARCFRDVTNVGSGEYTDIARFKLAALDSTGDTGKSGKSSRSNSSSRAPIDYVRKLYDSYASTFDKQLVVKLNYRTPDIISDMLSSLRESPWSSCVDLGCGTGLSGAVLKRRSLVSGILDGVDLSASMLSKARERDCVYDDLHVGDIVEFLRRKDRGTYNLVVSCDVFVYFGDLVPVFEAANDAMSKGGIFAFSTESLPTKIDAGGDCGYRLNVTKRFRHRSSYVETTAERAGFEKVAVRYGEKIRNQGGKPVLGDIYAFRKRRGPTRAASPTGESGTA
eukprot:g1409.t1